MAKPPYELSDLVDKLQANMMAKKLYKINEVTEKLRVSKTTVYRWIRANKFPKPIHLGEKSTAWRSEDIDNWLATRQQKGAN